MGDAASNQAVLAVSDLGQSNLDASPVTGAGAGGGGGGGGFIALDVSALSSLASEGQDTAAATATATAAPPRTPRTPKVVRSLSRKGERKPAADGDGNGAAGTGKRPPLSPLFVHVAAADDMSGLRPVHTPVAGTPGGKSRRLGRQPAPWLDPRRVVFFFATLSSVGTLILLYFTLSMSKMGGGGGGGGSDAR
ncbi:uncharacterized protein LOC102710713 [Oryza brachyantha]|uniref:Uncharacterized protein n=1 Tax=Oryza brachyantha TaxID=4533 RepID=J3MLJ4_ORYBR|nr:uncharacterized protein LOC102710713 [Oryza brachyantha]